MARFELVCAALIALFFGLAVLLNGYRLFLTLLPVWGFVFGFVLGADTVQALFAHPFLATVTSWVVGFAVGAAFAALSYLFYVVAMAMFSFGIGYGLGVGLMGLIGLESGLVAWLVGVVVGVVVAAVVILFNLQKWIVVLGTSLGGAAAVVGTILMVAGVITPAQFGASGVRQVMAHSIFWIIGYLVLFVVGFLAQFRNTQDFVVEAPADRW